MSSDAVPPAAGSAAGQGTGLRITVAIFGAAFLVRLAVAGAVPLIEVDGAYWTGLARAMLHGDVAHGLSPAWPPLYPAATAFAARVMLLFGAADTPATLEWAARLVSVVAGTLVLAPLHSLARRLLPEPWPAAALLLAVVNPRLIEYSAAALSESLFTLAIVAAVAAAANGRLAFAGATFGLAFLARPEGLLLGLATWLGAVWRGPAARGPLARLRPAFLVALLAVALPWLLFVRRETGEWSLGEKGAYNFWHAHRAAFARHFPAPVALPARVNRSPELAPRAIPGEVRPLAVLAAEPGAVIATSVQQLGQLLFSTYPVTIGWPVAVFAIAGLFVARTGPWWAILAPLAAAPLVIAPFSADRRLLVPLVPLAMPLAAAAFHALARKRPGRLVPAFGALLAAGLLAYALGIPKRADDAPEARDAGEWLREHDADLRGRAPRIVMARKPQVAFYAGALIADLPNAPADSILADAARIGADYLVADARAARGDRHQLAPWLDPANAPPAGWRRLRQIEGADPIVLYARDR